MKINHHFGYAAPVDVMRRGVLHKQDVRPHTLIKTVDERIRELATIAEDFTIWRL
jgi:hypothetical protein